jgi:dTDP-4-amino-4,6-dideoxygalactose transaminase
MDKVKQQRVIRLSKSCIGEEEKRAVMGVLDREYLGMGAEVKKLEEELTEFFGRPAVCVVNGTAALHLALQAAGVGVGDEVLVQSLTYVASFQAISATGATPIPCDVDRRTLTIDWRDAELRLTHKTKAIMPVHYSGGVGALEEIYDFANRYGLRVIEDAAHAFGTMHQGRRIGGFGDIACFSFDGIKNITSGEGGCIVTDDEEILRKIRDSRLLGVEKDTEKRYSGQRSWEFDVVSQGWRYHMSNIMAAIGLEQLKKFPDMASRRQELLGRYVDAFSNCPGLELIDSNELIVPHIFAILIGDKQQRDNIKNALTEMGVQTGLHYYPNHFLSLYNMNTKFALPVTESIYDQLITLPLHADITDSDSEYICECLLSALNIKN